MATRSTIAVVNPDNTVDQIYCHWDGYLSHNGRILKESYTTLNAVKELISHGDLSSLAPKVNPTGEHSFTKPEKGVCVYYGRDRGEKNTKPRTYSDLKVFLRNMQCEEYDYVFKDNEWFLVSNDSLVGYSTPIEVV